MIYLATPYSHKEERIRQARYTAALRGVATLLSAGRHVFSPIAHCHMVALAYDLPGDFLFWKSFNEDMIVRCDELVVLKLEGWESSYGVAQEIAFAEERGIPVSYWEEDAIWPA